MSQVSRMPDILEKFLSEINEHLLENKKHYEFVAVVKKISEKVYGKNIYVEVRDIDNIQLVIPESFSNELKSEHEYKFKGHFLISKHRRYGIFQFQVQQMTRLSFSKYADEDQKIRLLDEKLLHKDKFDFMKFKNLTECKVGLITSETSKALGDVKKVFKDHSGISYELIPVKVSDQKSVLSGLNKATEGNYDVIMIVRGGGKQKDLEQVFNSYEIVKAIHDSEIPIITGIGHHADKTHSDSAADKHESTPTNAAVFLVKSLGRKKREDKIGCAPVAMLIVILMLGVSFLI